MTKIMCVSQGTMELFRHIKDIEFSLNESEIRRNKIQEEAESLKVANALLINKNSKLESQQTDNKGNYPNASSNENVVERATEVRVCAANKNLNNKFCGRGKFCYFTENRNKFYGYFKSSLWRYFGNV